MPIKYKLHYTRELIRANPLQLFVFGDNLVRKGFGGQAFAARGEPNAVGLVTKRSPKQFLKDKDLFEVIRASAADQARLVNWHKEGLEIIWPWHGIGTGRAELLARAPSIADFWDAFLLSLDPTSKCTIVRGRD